MFRYALPLLIVSTLGACSWPPAGLLGGPPPGQPPTEIVDGRPQRLPQPGLPQSEVPRAPQLPSTGLDMPSSRGGGILR